MNFFIELLNLLGSFLYLIMLSAVFLDFLFLASFNLLVDWGICFCLSPVGKTSTVLVQTSLKIVPVDAFDAAGLMQSKFYSSFFTFLQAMGAA